MTASHQGSASTPPTTSQTWSAWNRLTWPVMVLIVGSLLAAAVLLIISDSPWWFTVPVLAVIAFAATAPVWRMRVDNEGFHVSTWVGVPRQTVPYSDIEAVAPVTVNIWDWGGWGWRKSIQGTGLITQSGPGFRIILHDEKIVEVSCIDNAQADAAVEAITAHLGDHHP